MLTHPVYYMRNSAYITHKKIPPPYKLRYRVISYVNMFFTVDCWRLLDISEHLYNYQLCTCVTKFYSIYNIIIKPDDYFNTTLRYVFWGDPKKHNEECMMWGGWYEPYLIKITLISGNYTTVTLCKRVAKKLNAKYVIPRNGYVFYRVYTFYFLISIILLCNYWEYILSQY